MPKKTGISARRRGPRAARKQAHAKPIGGNPFTAVLSAVKQDVDARLQGFLDARLDSVRLHGDDVVTMVDAIRDLCMRGGKRTRPALLVVGYRATSAEISLEPALDAGVAVELMHAYFLIHDDWMDRDVVRRGGPSVHALLGKRFRSQRLGDVSAILAGNYAAALAIEAISRVDVPTSRLSRVLACFSQMQTDAVIGQQLDVLAKPKDVERAYELKTGSYSVRGPLRLGALMAGAPPRILTALDRFSLPVGVAFQLRDDLLNVFGDPKRTGKRLGGDLKSGKRTLLMLEALKRARGRDHRLLSGVFGNSRASEAQLARAVEVIDRCGARAAIEARIEELAQSALMALRAGRLTPEATALLEGAARALAHRGN
jgi:geranylgeranyl diphosphate synthase, type I